ncbi:MAG: glycerol kinase GlpK [Planctomycetes bacterium]|nr:glycerol kinase GlpK [Planctomycetota bacterium]
MRGKYVMALDQGTTSSRCILFDHEGRSVKAAQRELRQIYPRPGWVEHHPGEIWEGQLGVAVEALAAQEIAPGDIFALGIANQRETTIVWDRDTGLPVHNAIVWQCRRTSDICDRLRADGAAPVIREKTGLPVDAYFSGTKLKWILDNVSGVRERAWRGKVLFGTVDTWLVWNLTGGAVHATDYTNASRTMLFNIHSLEWDDEILRLLDVPRCMLPEVRPSGAGFGRAKADVFGCEIPIAGMAGDQQSALFGQLCCEAGHAKNTYGTGCFLLMHTGKKAVESQNGLLTTIVASADGSVDYALEGSVFSGGSVIQWLRDELGLIRRAAESEELAVSVSDSAGVHLVPAFTGLGAPYWNSSARGLLTGLTRAAGRAHLVRAALESMAYQTLDILRAMEVDSGMPLALLKVDGGASANNFLMQFQADILNRQVIRPQEIETTALGCAYLAGLGAGFWDGLRQLRENRGGASEFSPAMPDHKRTELIHGWRRAVKSALHWAE